MFFFFFFVRMDESFMQHIHVLGIRCTYELSRGLVLCHEHKRKVLNQGTKSQHINICVKNRVFYSMLGPVYHTLEMYLTV